MGEGFHHVRTHARTRVTCTIGTSGKEGLYPSCHPWRSTPASSQYLYVRTYVRAVLAGRLGLSWLVACPGWPRRAGAVHDPILTLHTYTRNVLSTLLRQIGQLVKRSLHLSQAHR